MPSPLLLSRFDQPQDWGDISLEPGSVETHGACILGTMALTVPVNSSIDSPVIFGAPYTSFAMQITMPGGKGLIVSIAPCDPVTLLAYSDAVNGELLVPISGPINNTTKLVVWGNDTNEQQGGLPSVLCFKINFQDNTGTTNTNISFSLFGSSIINRGLSFE